MDATVARTKYEDVASRVVHLIDHGTFRPGSRIPSVRRLSDELKVSISTVLEAYRLLENRGVIESRPQSGYYVRQRATMPAMAVSSPPRRPAPVGVDNLVLRIMDDTRNPDLLQLGAAVPNPALLPTEKLNRHLAKVARQLQHRSNLYEVCPGCEPLRVQIAQRALNAGCVLTPDDIMITNGCLEAISLALRAICKPGDTVGIESPTYFGVLQAIELLDLKVLEIPTHPISGISVEAVRFALEQHSVSVFLIMANFNNPLGCCIPDENKRALVDLLAQHDIPLIEDDIYGDLYFGEHRPQVLKAYDRHDLVLLCSSYSKDLAPGYRVGWIAPARYRKQITRLKSATNIATATLPQHAIADFLETGGYDNHLRRIRRAYAQQMGWMLEAVARHFPPGTRVSQPQGGFVVWIELPGDVDSIELYEQALLAGITFAPGPIFSARQKYRNFIRLNYAYWSPAVEGAVATLGHLSAALAHPRSKARL